MQILRGTKRQITLMEWNEQLEKANKRLDNSKECYALEMKIASSGSPRTNRGLLKLSRE